MLYPVFLILLASRLGPGMSEDSVSYASAARSFARSGELLTFLGGQLSLWPPGLPIVLGLFESFGLNLQTVDVVINVICVAATVLLTYFLGKETFDSPLLGTLCAVLVGVSASTIRVFSMLWSEPIFTVLTLVAILILTKSYRRGSIAWWEILLVGVAVSLATTVRFAGVSLIPIAMLTVLLLTRTKGWLQATLMSLLAGLSASVGLVLVMIRNVSVGAAPLGSRYSRNVSLANVVGPSLRTLGGYVFPARWEPMDVALGLALALILAYAVWRIARRRTSELAVVVAFVFLYWLFILFSQITAGTSVVNERLLTPVFSSMVILAVFAIRDIGRWLSERTDAHLLGKDQPTNALAIGALGLFTIVVAFSVALGTRYALVVARDGIGYNSTGSLNSPLASAVTDLPTTVGLASSNPYRVYWTSGRSPVIQIPMSDSLAAEKADVGRLLKERIREGKVTYLAYFDEKYNYFDGEHVDLTPQDLANDKFQLRLVAVYDDGALWQVGPQP